MVSFVKTHPLLKIATSSLYDLPSPTNIRAMWNFGSLLGLCLIIQILTGLFLAIHYSGDISLAFYRVNHISRDVNYGWLLRIFHANGAKIFFYLFISSCRSWTILWFLFFYSYMDCGSGYFANCYGNSFLRLRITLGANILLRGHSYYKFIFSDPIYWRRSGTMNVRRVCSG